MKWNKLETAEALKEMIHQSFESPLIVYKHSSRCSISTLALSRLQSDNYDAELYFLDIIGFREISNEIENRFKVIHQSPQILIIHKGECVFNTSHLGISDSVVEKQLALLSD